MFNRAVLIVALAALSGCQPYSRSTGGVSALDKQVLYDFRNPALPAPPPLDEATQRRVLSAVSLKYYDDPAQCRAGNHSSGNTVLRAIGAAHGSFTAPGAKETVYLVEVARCGEKRASPTNRLLVFAGDHMAAAAETRYSAILKTYDLDSDHVTELLLSATNARIGEVTTEASLVRFDKKALIALEDFGSVYHDSCGYFRSLSAEQRKLAAKGVGPVADALVISYLPRPAGQMPSFFAERYHASCPAGANQKPAGWTREEIKN
jgi:hypothetical protein